MSKEIGPKEKAQRAMREAAATEREQARRHEVRGKVPPGPVPRKRPAPRKAPDTT